MGVLGKESGGLVAYAADRLIDRLDGLTDDEYLWEPVPGCWTVRPDVDAPDAAAGRWRADLGPTGSPATDVTPPPFTTIAWRLWHLGASPNPAVLPRHPGSGAELVEGWFGPSRPHSAADALGDAASAVRVLAEHWHAFAEAITAFPDDDYLVPIGPIGGPFAESTTLGLVLHIIDELVHHGAEVGVLRDLYARRQ